MQIYIDVNSGDKKTLEEWATESKSEGYAENHNEFNQTCYTDAEYIGQLVEKNILVLEEL